MIGLQGVTLHSERLTYRIIRTEDKEYYRAMLSDEAVTRPAGFPPPVREPEFDAFFEGLMQAGGGITILREEHPIGYLRVYPERVDSESEFAGKICVGVGFLIDGRYHGCGYGTEMLRTLTAYLKSRFDYVFADAFIDNPASNRVITKCGYRYVEDYTMEFEELGERKTCHSYVI